MVLWGKRKFAFENYGGSYQLRLSDAEDLAALEQLDEPFWIATSAPVDQFACDPVLLDRLDRDHSGRLQSWEIRAAARWLRAVLKKLDAVTERSDTLDLDTLNTGVPEGRRLYDAALQTLDNLDAADRETLTLAHVRDVNAIFAKGLKNGDGVIPPASVSETDLKAFVQDVMTAMGPVSDLNDSAGVDAAMLDGFLANARMLLEWQRKNEGGGGALPFGADTPSRYASYAALAGIIDSYFQQCRVAALNDMLGRDVEKTTCPASVFTNPDEADAYLRDAPLARPRGDRVLALTQDINPAYRKALVELVASVLWPILGEEFDGTTLDEAQWDRVKQAFAGYEQWLAEKPGGAVETVPADTLRGYLVSDLPQRLRGLIAADLAAGPQLEALRDLELLILLQRWFLDICNNFVSFPYLYHPKQRAMFEEGAVVMDGRIFNLNLRVTDAEAHSQVAARSGMYLLYSEVTGPPDEPARTIVTPVTRGPVDTLGEGKRGVLFDTAHREWDVRVVKVIKNPVSLREAMAAPFKRLAGLAATTAERFTSGAEQQLQARVTQAATTIESGLQQGGEALAEPAPMQPPVAAAPPRMRDLLLFGGVAAAALGSAFAYIAKTFSNMAWWHVLVAIGAGLLIVLVPTAVIAIVRLRRQNLSAILEGSGWAVNAPMRLTRRLRRLIVRDPPHPKSFRRLRKDLTKALARAVRLEEGEE